MFEDGTYDFYKIDLVVKKLLSMNIKPYIEINVYDTFEKEKVLLERIKCLFKYYIDTYGINEVKKWVIDIVSIKGQGDNKLYVNHLSNYEQIGFFKMFESIKFSIQEIIPDIRIGAGGIRIDDMYKHFINNFLYTYQKNAAFFLIF